MDRQRLLAAEKKEPKKSVATEGAVVETKKEKKSKEAKIVRRKRDSNGEVVPMAPVIAPEEIASNLNTPECVLLSPLALQAHN